MYIFENEAVNDAVEIVFTADRKKLKDMVVYFKEHQKLLGPLCEEFQEDFSEVIGTLEVAAHKMYSILMKI